MFIKLPILWKPGGEIDLQDLGIDVDYDDVDITKDVYISIDEICWFHEDTNPKYTILHLPNTEMVVALPIKDFLARIPNKGLPIITI